MWPILIRISDIHISVLLPQALDILVQIQIELVVDNSPGSGVNVRRIRDFLKALKAFGPQPLAFNLLP